MTDQPHPRRRTFAPVVLLGVLAGVVTAMAAAEPWFRPVDSGEADPTMAVGYSITLDFGVVTAANGLALVGLACWGVILVSRGRFRRVIMLLGLLDALALAVTVVWSYVDLRDDLQDLFDDLGAAPPEIRTTGWFWVGAVASILGLIAWVAAVRFVGDWPEMGRRYDTPSDSPPEDLWKAMDQGHDPTS